MNNTNNNTSNTDESKCDDEKCDNENGTAHGALKKAAEVVTDKDASQHEKKEANKVLGKVADEAKKAEDFQPAQPKTGH